MEGISTETQGAPEHPSAVAQPRKGFRWYSTPQSFVNGEVTVLAIIETILAMSISVGVAVWFGTLKHIAVAACVTPLLLLRTRESVERGLRWYKKSSLWWAKSVERSCALFIDWAFSPKKVMIVWVASPIWVAIGSLALLLYSFVVVVIPIVVRAAATVTVVAVHPIRSVTNIPSNWLATSVGLDSFHPPEIMPGSEKDGDVSFRAALRAWHDVKGNFMKAPTGLLLVLLFIPALVYRWSLKSTALIWSPLIYVLHSTFEKGTSLLFRLESITTLGLYRVIRWYSGIVLLMFAAKLWLFFAWSRLAYWWAELPGVNLLNLYVVPTEVPAWHITAVFNALVAFVIYLVADHELFKLKRDLPVSEKAVDGFIRGATFVRGLSSIYTIGCTLWVTVDAARQMPWPGVGPWLPG